jgi:hypothetical protein
MVYCKPQGPDAQYANDGCGRCWINVTCSALQKEADVLFDNVVGTFATGIECFKQRQSENLPSRHGLLITSNSMSGPTRQLAFHSINHYR